MPGLVTLPIERKTQFKLDDFHLLANLVSDPSAFDVYLNGEHGGSLEAAAVGVKKTGSSVVSSCRSS